MLIRLILTVLIATGLAGCKDNPASSNSSGTGGRSKGPVSAAEPKVDPEVAANLAKLSADDRKLAEAQKTCPMTGELLGSMGVPPKLTIKGEVVFLCCVSCREDAEKDPDKTLKAVADAKAKAKESGR